MTLTAASTRRSRQVSNRSSRHSASVSASTCRLEVERAALVQPPPEAACSVVRCLRVEPERARRRRQACDAGGVVARTRADEARRLDEAERGVAPRLRVQPALPVQMYSACSVCFACIRYSTIRLSTNQLCTCEYTHVPSLQTSIIKRYPTAHYTTHTHLAVVAAVIAGAVEQEQRHVVPRTPHGLGEALLLRGGDHGVIARAHDEHGRQRHVAALRQRQRRYPAAASSSPPSTSAGSSPPSRCPKK